MPGEEPGHWPGAACKAGPPVLGGNMSAVASPCTNGCRLDAASGWCEGCQRTLTEIATWASLSDEDKQAVWQALPARREAWPRLHPMPQGEPR